MHRLALVVTLTAGCGGGKQHEYPKLADGDSPDGKTTVKEPEPIASVPVLFEPGGSACLPTGVYDVSFDLSDAKITVVGQPEDFCRSWLMGVPTELLAQMKIDVEAGKLAVYWPQKTVVMATSPCEFTIASQPVFGTFKFDRGAGTGTGDYAVGSPNHPDEKCGAKGAKITLVRASS